MKDYCLYLSSFSNTFKIELDRIISAGFKVAELQAEFFATTRNKASRVFADNTPPASYLERAGVEVWGYVSPFWLLSEAVLGGLRDTGMDDDPYHLRRSFTRVVQGDRWYLKDRTGMTCMAMGQYPVADITVDACRDAIVDLLLDHPCQRLRFDNSMVHQDAYVRPLPHAPMQDYLDAQVDVYRRLRAAGKQVVVNGGWEMMDPQIIPWTYPLHDVVDGVMMEFPYRFWGWQFTPAMFAPVALAWADKRVILVAPYTTQGYKASVWPDYQTHARTLAGYADRLGWWFATGEEAPNQSMTGRIHPPSEWRIPDAPKPLTLEARVEALEQWREAMLAAS